MANGAKTKPKPLLIKDLGFVSLMVINSILIMEDLKEIDDMR